MQAQTTENTATGMIKAGFSSVDRHGPLVPYQLPSEWELDALKRLGVLDPVPKEMLFHEDPDVLRKKFCPTRHGCSGATNCDYAYASPK